MEPEKLMKLLEAAATEVNKAWSETMCVRDRSESDPIAERLLEVQGNLTSAMLYLKYGDKADV